MSLAGGVIIGVYLLLLPMIKRYFISRWRYFILKLAGIFFLIPFPYYKQYYIDFLSFIFNITKKVQILSEPIELHPIQIDMNGRIISGMNEVFNVFTVTWFGVGFVFFTYQIINYILFKRRLLSDAQILVDDRIYNILNNYKTILQLKTNIKVLNNKFIIEPFTIGILHPIILLPMNNYSYEDLELILYHEMCHIKNKDLFIKLCGLGALSLHWFNPLVYILYREIGIVCENVCDERIVIDQSIEFRKRYGNLIIDTIEKKEIYSNALIISFSGNKKVTKERILMMKNVKRPKNFVKVFSIVVSIGIALLGSTMVFAYDEAEILHWENSKLEMQKRLRVMEFSFSINDIVIKENLENANRNHLIKDIDNIQVFKECEHHFILEICATHENFSDGSCKKILENVKYCSICGYSIFQNRINTITYETCIH